MELDCCLILPLTTFNLPNSGKQQQQQHRRLVEGVMDYSSDSKDARHAISRPKWGFGSSTQSPPDRWRPPPGRNGARTAETSRLVRCPRAAPVLKTMKLWSCQRLLFTYDYRIKQVAGPPAMTLSSGMRRCREEDSGEQYRRGQYKEVLAKVDG